MNYAMWRVATVRMSPNDARRVVYAIGEYFFSSVFFYTNYVLSGNGLDRDWRFTKLLRLDITLVSFFCFCLFFSLLVHLIRFGSIFSGLLFFPKKIVMKKKK